MREGNLPRLVNTPKLPGAESERIDDRRTSSKICLRWKAGFSDVRTLERLNGMLSKVNIAAAGQGGLALSRVKGLDR